MFCKKRISVQVERGKQFSTASFWPGSTFQFVTSESDQRTATSLADSSAECGTPMSSSSDQKRRTLLLTALAAAPSIATGETAFGAFPVQGSQIREMGGGPDARRPFSL
jgi:hypothetical protein